MPNLPSFFDRQCRALRGLSYDMEQMVLKIVRAVEKSAIFQDCPYFVVCVPKCESEARICPASSVPEPDEMLYINIGISRHAGDLYIMSVEYVGGN